MKERVRTPSSSASSGLSSSTHNRPRSRANSRRRGHHAPGLRANGIILAANANFVMTDDPATLALARHAVHRRLAVDLGAAQRGPIGPEEALMSRT